MLLVRLAEPSIVEHVVSVDYRQWPGLIYDSADPYPLYLSSISLYHCGGPDDLKLRVTHMYEIIRYRRRKEDTGPLTRKMFALQKGDKRSRSFD